MYKKDFVWLGMIIGIVIPLVVFGIVFLLQKYVEIEEHFRSLLYILGIGFNALIMRYAMNKGFTKIGTGILLVSFIYAILFFIYKFRLIH